jgi:GDP-L-fucose synthase
MKIFVAGHKGMVGSAICRALEGQDCTVLTVDRAALDLTNELRVRDYFNYYRPNQVVLAAAKVGGIGANSAYPVDFLLENLRIQNNVISAAADFSQKLLFLGSSCIYPRDCPQPIKEEYLLTGPLEPTNQWYAVAKIAGIKLCQAYRQQYGCDFISVMPCNLYGPNDNFDPETGHALPAMIAKFHKAKVEGGKVHLWGNGLALREWLHVDDLARACLLCLKKYSSPEPINIGSGTEVTTHVLSEAIATAARYHGVIEWDTDKPNGTPRKLLDSSKIRGLGWEPKIGLEEGIRAVYEHYKASL